MKESYEKSADLASSIARSFIHEKLSLRKEHALQLLLPALKLTGTLVHAFSHFSLQDGSF